MKTAKKHTFQDSLDECRAVAAQQNLEYERSRPMEIERSIIEDVLDDLYNILRRLEGVVAGSFIDDEPRY